jgi:hypothetical protein
MMTKETNELGKKFVPMPLCPPQFPQGLTLFRTLPFLVRGRLECYFIQR